MSPVLATRRRAEEFNTLVESSTGTLDDGRYADVLALVDQLRALEPPAPRPDFTLALREQLMEAADTLLLPSPETQRLTLPRRSARDRRIAAAVGAAAIVGASTSIAVAAQSALPGEMLYPVKRLLENAETGAHLSDSAKGTSLLSNATDRLTEVTVLSRTSDLDEAPAIAATLTTFSEQTQEASDLLLTDYADNGNRSSVAELNDFTVASMATLAELEAVLPPESRDEFQDAVRVLVEIDAAASAACPTCSGGLDQLPAALLSPGQLAEPSVVVVPPPLVEESPTRGGGKQTGSKDGSKGGDKRADGSGSGVTPAAPLELPDLPGLPASNGSGGGAGDDDPTGPLDDVLGGVTGQGGQGTSGGGGAGAGTVVDDTVEAVEDVIDLLDDPQLP